MRSRKLSLGIALVLALAAAERGVAADIAVDARIDDVKVYQEGATITRRAQVSIPAGTHRLVFTNLPATVDTDTLRIAVANREARLGAIEVERITDRDVVSAQ